MEDHVSIVLQASPMHIIHMTYDGRLVVRNAVGIIFLSLEVRDCF
jgi:hypothetical protein